MWAFCSNSWQNACRRAHTAVSVRCLGSSKERAGGSRGVSASGELVVGFKRGAGAISIDISQILLHQWSSLSARRYFVANGLQSLVGILQELYWNSDSLFDVCEVPTLSRLKSGICMQQRASKFEATQLFLSEPASFWYVHDVGLRK